MSEYIKCDECDGHGQYRQLVDIPGYGKKYNVKTCKKCLGDGKLDWIENAVGKKEMSFRSYIKKILKEQNKCSE